MNRLPPAGPYHLLHLYITRYTTTSIKFPADDECAIRLPSYKCNNCKTMKTPCWLDHGKELFLTCSTCDVRHKEAKNEISHEDLQITEYLYDQGAQVKHRKPPSSSRPLKHEQHLASSSLSSRTNLPELSMKDHASCSDHYLGGCISESYPVEKYFNHMHSMRPIAAHHSGMDKAFKVLNPSSGPPLAPQAGTRGLDLTSSNLYDFAYKKFFDFSRNQGRAGSYILSSSSSSMIAQRDESDSFSEVMHPTNLERGSKALSLAKEKTKKCRKCSTKHTPEWRKGPDGKKSLCNACGLHFSRTLRKREKMRKDTITTAILIKSANDELENQENT